jgi:hypothetical protein
MMRRLLLVLPLVVVPALSHAADQLVLGNQLVVKNPSTPDKRKVVVKAKEPSSDDSIVGNPVASGATLEVRTTGATPSAEVFPLPAGTSPGGGKAFWTGNATKGFKYKDAKGVNGPVKSAVVKKNGRGAFQITAVIVAKLGAVGIVPPGDGTGGCALLQLTGGDSYSVAFIDGKITNKGSTLFKVVKPTQQGTCVTSTTTTSTTTSTSTTTTTLNGLCSNGTLDAGEQCDPPGSSCGAGGGTCQITCTCSCDFLDPSSCLFPFPSDWFTVPDATKDTGKRVNFSNAGMPKNKDGVPIESSDYNRNDGFSVGATSLTRVPNVDLAMTGAAPITDVERSLDVDAPVVLVNATTLQHHLMWVEIDSNDTIYATIAIIIHPSVNLE